MPEPMQPITNPVLVDAMATFKLDLANRDEDNKIKDEAQFREHEKALLSTAGFFVFNFRSAYWRRRAMNIVAVPSPMIAPAALKTKIGLLSLVSGVSGVSGFSLS